MFGPRSLTRVLLAAPFVVGGVNALRSSSAMAPAAELIGTPIAEKLGLPTDAETLVKINAGTQIGAGALLALGVFSRPAAVVLAASLVPTTLAGHRFWEKVDAERRAQITQFAKNAGLLGGLLAHALDSGSRPSVFWSGRHAAVKAGSSIADVAHSVADTVGGAAQHLPGMD